MGATSLAKVGSDAADCACAATGASKPARTADDARTRFVREFRKPLIFILHLLQERRFRETLRDGNNESIPNGGAFQSLPLMGTGGPLARRWFGWLFTCLTDGVA